jgi:hypothetical protein
MNIKIEENGGTKPPSNNVKFTDHSAKIIRTILKIATFVRVL